jgi:hypothetical protein
MKMPNILIDAKKSFDSIYDHKLFHEVVAQDHQLEPERKEYFVPFKDLGLKGPIKGFYERTLDQHFILDPATSRSVFKAVSNKFLFYDDIVQINDGYLVTINDYFKYILVHFPR